MNKELWELLSLALLWLMFSYIFSGRHGPVVFTREEPDSDPPASFLVLEETNEQAN